MKYSVVIAHPGKQHAFRTASALHKNDTLQCFITSVYNKPGRITNFLYRMTQGSIKKKIGSHYIDDIPQSKVIIFNEFLGVFSLISLKIPFIKKYYININNFLNDSFGIHTFKYVKKCRPNAVISYDNNSALLFEKLSAECPNIIRILDVSIATRPFMQQSFKNDFEKTKARELIDNYAEIWSKESISRTYREINKADYFLAPSEVVKRSLIYCGVDESKIKIVPYGTDCSKFVYKEKLVQSGPLKIIFVGSVDYRKGIHHLLNVISQFAADSVDVKLVGAYAQEDSIYKKYHTKSNIHFCGFVTHDILANYYHDSEEIVFPTLGEGFGMVVLEAMSCGLPVIISDLAGGNDVITEGVDGFEFKAGDEGELFEKIKWFIENRDKIPQMARNARKKAESYTWDIYSQRLQKAIDEIIEGKK